MIDLENRIAIANNNTFETTFNAAVTPIGPFLTDYYSYPSLFWPSPDFTSMFIVIIIIITIINNVIVLIFHIEVGSLLLDQARYTLLC